MLKISNSKVQVLVFEAECHMEIAALYHQGRITLRRDLGTSCCNRARSKFDRGDELRGPPGKKEAMEG